MNNKSKENGASDEEKIIETLHPLEIKVISFLKQKTTLNELIKLSGLKEVEVMRAIQWLENKELLNVEKHKTELIELDKNGQIYKKQGLPEMRLLEKTNETWIDIKSITAKAKIDESEKNICLGMLRSKAAIEIKKQGEQLMVRITSAGKSLLEKRSLEEKFLQKKFPIKTNELKDEDKFAFQSLIRRKNIIKSIVQKESIIIPSKKAISLSKIKINTSFIDKITPAMLKDSSWKNKQFRRYDVKINVPKISGGVKHPYNEFLDKTRKTLLKMGFVEMTGPIIETEFWNFDALFQPQNHPARTWSATYRIKSPKYGKLPDKKIVDNVAKTHENGANTGSTGWKYKWDAKIASQLMPRAHDTAISPRYMAKNIKIPGKYFSLVRCFRPDVIDATHGVEFNQMGGIVIGKELSFKHLLGLLRDCAIELTGATEVKFFPDYFPFTEPSVQISVKHPKFGWMELAGAGVFRPELCIPLGIKEPVIAWGFGIDRLAMLHLGIDDIRDLFSHDLKFLKESKKVRNANY